ncbi:MAG: hypothetical protein UHM08_04085 [Bacteroidales bacterium]|nr:hypothetical protein [Bacteroidales bacterium]
MQTMIEAYVWAGVTMAIFFLIAVLSANMIIFKPNDPGTTKRRIWFWVLCVLAGVVGFLINFLTTLDNEVSSNRSDYIMHSGIALAIAILLYIAIGFIISKIFKNSKVGTWF